MLDSNSIVVAVMPWFFLVYFVAMHAGYLLLDLVCLSGLRRYMASRAFAGLPTSVLDSEPPVSIVVPTHNQQETIAAALRALLQLDYSEYEVIVVDDGSRDGTLARLQRDFQLVLFPEAYWRRLRVRHVYGVYRSATHPRLRVIDKSNGGKADALNAGINAARYPLFCALGPDTVLQRDSLRRVVQPFLDHPATVASCATARVGNDCTVTDGFLSDIVLPRRLLDRVQLVECLRARVFGRLGWSQLNAMLAVSGAFGIFRKEAVIAAGGYRIDIVDADSELIMRLHRVNRLAHAAYRIALVPEPVCWRKTPATLKGLKAQRIGWQRGLSGALMKNAKLLLHPRGGAAGWVAFPFLLLFEWLGPLLEVLGYLVMIALYAAGFVSTEVFVAFMSVAIGFGVLLSLSALGLEENCFQPYRGRGQLALIFAALIENLGYRQLVALWRVAGLLGATRTVRGHSPEPRHGGSLQAADTRQRDRPSSPDKR